MKTKRKPRMSSCRLPVLSLLVTAVLSASAVRGADVRADLQLLQSKPDVTLTSQFPINAKPAMIDALLKQPLLLAHLWESHQFGPAYKVRLQGDVIHVDDPTGIQGDLYVAESSANRYVWVGYGSLNHRLVPSFRGRMALVLTLVPKGSGVEAHTQVFVRADSRILGFLGSSFFPLVRARVENRVKMNGQDAKTLLEEAAADPQRAASRLKGEEARTLLAILTPQPAAPPALKPPAATPAKRPATR